MQKTKKHTFFHLMRNFQKILKSLTFFLKGSLFQCSPANDDAFILFPAFFANIKSV